MFFTGNEYGIISHLRTCLNVPAGGTYNDPGGTSRVSSAADAEAFINGQTKLTVPYIMVTLGNTTVENQSHAGSTSVINMVERLDLYAVLNAKTDKVGKDAADQVHQVRLDLLACLFGWNPSRAAECATPPVDFGYCTQLMEFVGDSFFSMHREIVVWEFNFDLRSTLTVQAQGFGQSNPIAVDALESIYADFSPTEVTATENPAIQAVIDPL
jgi:hypothetical protein